MSKKSTIGIDVGGTKIAAAVVEWGANGSFRIGKRIEEHTEKQSAQATLKQIARIAQELGHTKTRVGVGFPGFFTLQGKVVSAPHLHTRMANLNIQKMLTTALKTKVHVENDARCFTVAEAVLGSAKKHTSVFGITLGTGIGGGVVMQKMLWRGAHGYAGEIGHMHIGDDELESIASGTGAARRYSQAIGVAKTAYDLADDAAAGVQEAQQVLRDAAHALGIAISNIQKTVDPEAFVIGGGFAKIDGLLHSVRESAKTHALHTHLQRTPIYASALGSDAGTLGAALLAQHL